MSIYTDMIPAILLVNDPQDSLSGAPIENYVKVSNINVAIYKNDSFKSVQSVKYAESSHNGIAMFRDFDDKKEYRIKIDDTEFDITYFNTQGRFATLLLKARTDTW